VADQLQPGVQRVVEVASRKGVALDIRFMPEALHTAEEVAAVVDADLGQIATSLVFVAPRPEGRLMPIICLVSGRNQVDLALLAAVSGEVALRPASTREARDLTGYAVGTIPPFGHGRGVQILMDQDLCAYQWIWAAAGSDTAVFRAEPRTLRMLSNAIVAPIAATTWLRLPMAIEPRLQFEAS
jgi:prolyl-tRNA editing enzyme YbaK/EbsC (Cys-tRNA(Pro) deacylase)